MSAKIKFKGVPNIMNVKKTVNRIMLKFMFFRLKLIQGLEIDLGILSKMHLKNLMLLLMILKSLK